MFAAYAVVWLRANAGSLARYRIPFTVAALLLAGIAYALILSCNAVQYDPGGREKWDLAGRTELALVTCGFIVVSCFSIAAWRRLVGNPLLVFLSLISYNLYLWHTLIGIWMWTRRVPYSSMPDVHADDVWKVWYLSIATLLSVGIATAITYFIERPLLSTVKAQSFSFDWKGALARVRVQRSTSAVERAGGNEHVKVAP
jgi:peptidoglycan/LPS O-acetylase OafA/YrhL